MKQEFFAEFDGEGEVLEKKGDIVKLMDYAEKTIESDYHVPYLAHATMEPLNCTVHVQQDRVDVWVGHQHPEDVVQVVSRLTGVSVEGVYVHNCYLGGGFGRAPPTEEAEALWRRLLAACKTLAGCTCRLVRDFRTTCFGIYRCHQPRLAR